MTGMKYSKVSAGRIFLVRFDHRDDLIHEIEKFVAREKISLGTMILLGALEKGEIVTGPEENRLPASPNWGSFDGAWEVFGQGIIISENGADPKIHLHCSLGKKERTLTGCLRKTAEVFVTVEAVITELTGISPERNRDSVTGQNLLHF